MVLYLRYLLYCLKFGEYKAHPDYATLQFIKTFIWYFKFALHLFLVYTSASVNKETNFIIYSPSKHKDKSIQNDKLDISNYADFANDISDRRSISGVVIT